MTWIQRSSEDCWPGVSRPPPRVNLLERYQTDLSPDPVSHLPNVGTDLLIVVPIVLDGFMVKLNPTVTQYRL